MHIPLKIQEEESSGTSEELAAGVGRIKISDDSPEKGMALQALQLDHVTHSTFS